MASEKEEIILDIKIDQGSALRDLEKLEKVILDNKDAQKELNDAYKKGSITQDEYIKENLRLQQNLKKEQDQKKVLNNLIEVESNSRNALKIRVAALTKEYDNLNLKTDAGIKRQKELEKELTSLNSQITKTSKSAGLFKDQIGNYPQQFGEAAKSINIAGVSVGDITSKLASFASPATAAVGIVSALGAAYASSTIGSKDLQLATDQLSSGFAIASNNFARFVQDLTKSSRKGGPLESAAYAFNRIVFGQGTANQADAQAQANETIRILEISEQFAKGYAKDAEVRAEKARIKRDNDNDELLKRLAQTKKVEDALTNSEQIRTVVLLAKKKAIIEASELYESDLQAQLRVASVETEIKDIHEEINGKLTENKNARINILKLIEEEKAQQERLNRIKNTSYKITTGDLEKDAKVEQDIKKSFLVDESNIQLQIRKDTYERLKEFDDEYERQRTLDHLKEIEIRHQADLAEAQASANILGSLSALFKQGGEEYKLLASAQTLISTYVGATKAYESQASIPYVGPALGAVAAAEAIIAGLANLAIINGVEFAEGGYTGDGGKYEAAGIVHKGEYVVPQSVNYSKAAQPHIAALESMRLTGYYNGGLVTNSMTQGINSEMAQANAVKNLPTPVVSVKEISLAQKRVQVKENISTL